MTSTFFSDELTLSQKLSTFCLQFGGQLATAKERLKSGEPLDDVLDQLFLLALGDLCRTLNCSDALLNHAALLPNLGDDHHPQQQQQPNQMWTQMLNCFTSSLNEGDEGGDDDGEEEDEYEDDEDQQQQQQQQQQVSADMFSKHMFPMHHHHHHHQAFLQAIMPFIKQEEPEVQEELPKLFHCEYPNCGKSFRRQTDLKSHFQRHNAVKQFECAWPECTFKSTYSSSVGEHIGKLHFKCQTRGPNRADYLDEAKKWIRKINTSADEGDGAGGADKPGTSAAGTSGSPFPTGPFLCCGRNFSNWFNLNKHQNSRKCVSAVLANHSPQKQQNLQKQNLQNLQTLPKQNHQQKFQKDLPVDVSFTAAAAAAVAVYSQQSISGATDNFGGFVEEDDADADDGGQPALKKAKVEEVKVELSSSDDSSDDDSSDSSDSDD